jgi:osmotically-inducible protein OsmY
LSGLVAGSVVAVVACERSADKPAPAAPDTTTKSGSTPPKTATDQAESARDVGITADIRKAIMDDKSMSVSAQNCTVVTRAGVVTLSGDAASQSEKDAIEAKAKAVAGVSRVENQLIVKPG